MVRLKEISTTRLVLTKSILIACLFLLIASPALAKEGALAKKAGWHMIWHDEFEGDSIDLSKWRVEDAALVKNNELQYYTPEEVYVHDGVLTLRSSKQEMGSREYTSGLVETKGKFSFQYGRVEIRAKLPKGRGIWPAHWMMPTSGKWPPEIDIMELIGHQPTVVYMSLHTGVWPAKKHFGKLYIGPDFSEDFHEFVVEWDEDQICWYVDGEGRCQTGEDIPKEPFYVILNTAVGGSWPGNPNKRTKFPQYHEIDYVRVYVKEIPGTYFLNTFAENGKVTVTPLQQRYSEGQKIKLYAKPGIGFEFDKWQGDFPSEENPRFVVAQKHMDIKAIFKKSEFQPKLLSLGKPAKASSQETKHRGASNVTDADLDTRWSSEFSDSQWIEIDLEQECFIEAIRLRWEVAHSRHYAIKTSHDGTNWQTAYVQQNSPGDIEEITELNTEARYIALHGIKRATQFGHSLWEIEVFGQTIHNVSQ